MTGRGGTARTAPSAEEQRIRSHLEAQGAKLAPAQIVEKVRAAMTPGAMGSRQHNFYNDAFRRAGHTETAAEVQRLWLDGRRDEAAARVPDALVLRTKLLGTEAMVRERIRAYRRAGVTTLRVEPDAETFEARVATLGRVVELVREVRREPLASPSGQP